MAKYDEDFYKKLFDDRVSALEETGLPLSQGEKLLLNSISDEQLARNISEFRVPGITRKSLASWAKAAAVVVLLSSLALNDPGCDWANKPETGSAPDDTTQVVQMGIRPDTLPPCEGITPDLLDLDEDRSDD
jgi:hypothetical protein